MDTIVDRLVARHAPSVRQHFAIVMSSDGRKMIAWGASRLACEGFDHAEENAIRQLASARSKVPRRHLQNLTLVVARKHNNQLKQSKPCSQCCRAIREAGVFKWVEYSTECGAYARVRVRDLHSEYFSIGRLRRAREVPHTS